MKTTSQNELLVKAYLWSGFSNLNFSPQNKWIFEWYTKNPSNDNQWALQSSQGNSVKPSHRKKFINWLFLLLGQMLGYCTLQQLKYLFKHTKNHWPKPKKKKKPKKHTKNQISGSLSHLLSSTKKKNLELCKQLHPDGPFDRLFSSTLWLITIVSFYDLITDFYYLPILYVPFFAIWFSV